ncbi:ThuA domain-containing protein [Negadavirga shengliensis]|uniref:ThuA domain-containing protein n=1 Tax=Negadavirga shengliensis TaxID=1389218 RepID=A0ABV9T8J9_9BACT
MLHLVQMFLCAFAVVTGFASTELPISVLLITGGHDFERERFFEMMDALENIQYVEVKHPKANDHFVGEDIEKYDLILFYDMVQEITADQKQGLERWVDKGIGLVFLHHSIVSYQNWDYYRGLVGGRYLENDSGYQHDVAFRAHIMEKGHPIVKGLSNFEVYDEIYKDVDISDNVQPLISTDHPESMPLLAWCQQLSPSTRTVYIQPGHGPEVYALPAYRKLLQQAIQWAAGR